MYASINSSNDVTVELKEVLYHTCKCIDTLLPVKKVCLFNAETDLRQHRKNTFRCSKFVCKWEVLDYLYLLQFLRVVSNS